MIISNRKEFDRNPKQTATPIFRPQRFEKIMFTPLNAPKWQFGGLGVGFEKCSFVKVGRVIAHLKGLV